MVSQIIFRNTLSNAVLKAVSFLRRCIPLLDNPKVMPLAVFVFSPAAAKESAPVLRDKSSAVLEPTDKCDASNTTGPISCASVRSLLILVIDPATVDDSNGE